MIEVVWNRNRVVSIRNVFQSLLEIDMKKVMIWNGIEDLETPVWTYPSRFKILSRKSQIFHMTFYETLDVLLAQ